MLIDGVVNPLNVHNMRRMDWCPPHFEKIIFDPMNSDWLVFSKAKSEKKLLSDWIYENLSGRFYIGYHDTQENNKSTRKTVVAFEIANEASFFSLNLNNI
jgi:hypothetical protein